MELLLFIIHIQNYHTPPRFSCPSPLQFHSPQRRDQTHTVNQDQINDLSVSPYDLHSMKGGLFSNSE